MSDARINFGKEVKKMRKNLFPQKSQTGFSKIINEHLNDTKFILSQKKVSDIERGNKIPIPESFVIEFAKISNDFGYEFDKKIVSDFLKEIKNIKKNAHNSKPIISIVEHEDLVSKSTRKVFEQYIGSYNCLFHSTDSSEPKAIKGIMEIKEDSMNNQCRVTFSIIENSVAIKEYEGIFILNSHYNMWYSLLVGKEKQEICMIASQHFNSTLRKNLYNIALVITTSAGIRKRPTMHRMFISRDDITKNKMDLIIPQLKLNDDTIFISETELTNLKSDMQKKLTEPVDEKQKRYFDVVLKCIAEIEKSPSEKYYRISEAIIYDSNKISKDKKILGYAISKIRRYTDNKYYNKLSDTVHEICTNIMKFKL